MSASLPRLLELRAQGYAAYNKLRGGREPGPSTEAEDEWARDTATAIRPFGEIQAARFENPAGGGGDQLNRYAARLYTLDRFLDEIQDRTVAKPKNKGGRPKDEHPELVKAVQLELWAQNERGEKRNKALAYRLALEPLELDPDEYDARKAWLEKQAWFPAAPEKPVFPTKNNL